MTKQDNAILHAQSHVQRQIITGVLQIYKLTRLHYRKILFYLFKNSKNVRAETSKCVD